MIKQLKSSFYNTGDYWIFNNGQYGEKIEIKQQDVYELQIIDGKVTGLYFHQNNNCGGSHLNSACYSIHSLSGAKLAAYNDLINQL